MHIFLGLDIILSWQEFKCHGGSFITVLHL